MSAVPAVQIRTAALAGAGVDVLLRMGSTVGAKLLERNGANGLLLLAGVPVVAQLPPEVAAGAWMRLRVTAVAHESVTMQLLPEAPEAPAAQQAQQQQQLPTVALPLPDGSMLRLAVTEREADGKRGSGSRAAAIALRYDTPQLGRMDMRITPESVAVHLAAGEPAQRAAAAAGELRERLQAVSGQPAQVTIHPRQETIDVRG